VKKSFFIYGAIWLFVAFFSTSVGAQANRGLLITWRGETPCEQGLKAGLIDRGIDIELETFDANQDIAALEGFLKELDERRYSFVYTFGTTVSTAAARKIRTTPLVFGIVTNPVKAGLIADWKSSGNNITGVSHAVSYETQIEFIRSIGEFQKIGILFNPDEENGRIARDELKKLATAKGMGFASTPLPIDEPAERTVGKLVEEKVDLIYLPSDSRVVSRSGEITEAVNRAGIPSYGALEQHIQNGAMIGIVASYENVGRALAGKIAQILAGQKPSEIPSEILSLDMQTILVNGPVVEKLGFPIPYELLRHASIVE
jgi:putative ABC transport system substrate-binding protein